MAAAATSLPEEDTLSRLGAEVPLGRVDRALKELWDHDDAKTRASLMNFAIYSEDAASLERNITLLEQITSEHACRALLILCVPTSGAPRARAWINALCRPYQGSMTVCSEQLSFLLEGGGAAVVQNVVFAHLDSDLPLVVWWQGDLTSNFEERFYSRIDRLFIDSSQWHNPAAEFALLEEAYRAETSDFEVHDLSWTRSHFLRTALANCFQDKLALEQLPHVEQIEITYARGHRIAALLLAAWIGGRLDCRLALDVDGVRFAKPGGGAIRLALHEKASGVALQSLALTGPCLRAVVKRDAASTFVHVSASCNDHQHEEILPADVESESELISGQLSRAHGTSLFFEMVPMLRQMLGG